MKVEFTVVDVNYATPELGMGLRNALSSIKQVAREYEGRDDSRTLVVVLTCPCCRFDTLLWERNAVLVSPFCGIDRSGYNIHRVDKYPPFRSPGVDREARDLPDFLNSFRATIEGALA